MAFVVREPAIVAGRLRLRGELLSGSDAEEVNSNDFLLSCCVGVPDAEIPSKPAPKKDSE